MIRKVLHLLLICLIIFVTGCKIMNTKQTEYEKIKLTKENNYPINNITPTHYLPPCLGIKIDLSEYTPFIPKHWEDTISYYNNYLIQIDDILYLYEEKVNTKDEIILDKNHIKPLKGGKKFKKFKKGMYVTASLGQVKYDTIMSRVESIREIDAIIIKIK